MARNVLRFASLACLALAALSLAPSAAAVGEPIPGAQVEQCLLGMCVSLTDHALTVQGELGIRDYGQEPATSCVSLGFDGGAGMPSAAFQPCVVSASDGLPAAARMQTGTVKF
ncbi:MAG: hypothetical protein LC624_05715 [Halobacteriales archaeon]|nr:hypothetical protein [Halobacteriales archaeon]